MKSSVILNVILFLSLGTTMMSCTNNNASNNAVASTNTNSTAGTKIVYINTDSLLQKYQLSVELNEAFLKKQEDRNTELNIKAKDLDRQKTEFERKVNNGGFLNETRAQSAYQDLMKQGQKLQQLQQELTEQAMREQAEVSKQIIDAISTFLKGYCAEKGYDMVLSTVVAGNVLYAQDGFDVTEEVIKQLNEQYKSKAESAE